MPQPREGKRDVSGMSKTRPWLPWTGLGDITNETNGTHTHVTHPEHFKFKVPESAAVSQDSGLQFDRARKKIH